MKWQINPRGKKFLSIEWAKDSKLVVVDLPRLIMIQDSLIKHYPKNYVHCNNAFNRLKEQSNKSTTLTNADNFLNYQSKIRWCFDRHDGNSFCLYIGICRPNDVQLKRICTAQYARDLDELSGSECLEITENKLIEHHSKSWNELLGKISYKTIPQDIIDAYLDKLQGKAAVNNLHGNDEELLKKYPNITPEQLMALQFKAMQAPRMVWISQSRARRKVYHYNKADFSSAYPSRSNVLPTWKGHKVIEGKANLKDYPDYKFAFYMKAHNFIIGDENIEYAKLCKNPWLWKYASKPLVREIPDNEEITILMKSAEDISDIWDYYYDIKNTAEDEAVSKEAKQIMLKTIGCFESLTSFRHAFRGWVSAVVYARHIKAMLDKIAIIESKGGEVIQLATDCIGWLNANDADVSTPDKYLGAFHREHTNTTAYIKACGVYAIVDEKTGNILPPKLQGYRGIDPKKLYLKDLRDLENITSTELVIKFIRNEYGYVTLVPTDKEIL